MKHTRIAILEEHLQDQARFNLATALTEIAEKLSYNEDGQFEPEESIAANSAADFIESVKDTFRNILNVEL